MKKKKMFGGAERGLFERAKNLRKNQTSAEEILWIYLKTKPEGYKFRRQHPYSIYILDFYCHQLKLVIEVDGLIHNNPEIQVRDQQRESHLKNDGLRVLRFSNNVIIIDRKTVFQKIKACIKKLSEIKRDLST